MPGVSGKVSGRKEPGGSHLFSKCLDKSEADADFGKEESRLAKEVARKFSASPPHKDLQGILSDKIGYAVAPLFSDCRD
jgi:hypothetical protein